MTPNVSKAAFLADVVSGLSACPKTLPSKYFYDEAGSRLFERICKLPEYYPTRVETALLREIAPELARVIEPGAALIEFGSGASDKTSILLKATETLAAYVPIDISADALKPAAERVALAFPRLEVLPIEADFTAPIVLPASVSNRARVGFFPGSTIGNFAPSAATRFLEQARSLLGSGSLFIVGFDVVKFEAVLVAAYDDAEKVTAAFDLNILTRINRELGADFDLTAFRHEARWNAGKSRMEMHLVSQGEQTASVQGRRFDFDVQETIHTENSYKFDPDAFSAIATAAGWEVVRTWIAPAPAFAITLLSAP